MAPVADRTETTLCTRGDTLSAWRHRSKEAIGGEKMTPLVSRAVRRARVGDQDALWFLCIRHADDVYSYARTIVSGHEEARAVTQRVLVTLERLIECYEEEQNGPFPVWIRHVARSVAADADALR